MKALINRLYGNYLMPSRLQQYDELLRCAADAGYCQTSVRDFFRSIEDAGFVHRKFVVHRHDIDSDIRTARKIFDIEKKYGVKSTFYFRLSTLDFKLMQEIDEYGSEASYHYEEIATFAKSNNIRSSSEVIGRLQEIRNDFVKNFEFIQGKFGGKLVTVASHGDFANRQLAVSNTEILNDSDLRRHCGIECESYDRALLDKFDIYISDRPYPGDFHPTSPFNAIGTQKKICVLTHPVQWETNWIETTKINFLRLYEGLVWRPVN
jgi:hypothetical protein